MKARLYTDALAAAAAGIAVLALALLFDQVADPAALTYAANGPALLLPSG